MKHFNKLSKKYQYLKEVNNDSRLQSRNDQNLNENNREAKIKDTKYGRKNKRVGIQKK